MIRKACPEDAAAIRNLAEAAYSPYIPRLTKPPAPMVADFLRHIMDDDVVVFDVGGKIAGYAILIFDRERALLDNIAVDPDAQRRGIGFALIGNVEEKARRNGYTALELYTNVVMTENLAWYAKLGFQETKRVAENGFNRIYMKKAL